MTKSWQPALVGIGSLLLLLVLGFGFMLGRSIPAVVTQEVTRVVVATATPTSPSIVVEKVVTVTVIVATMPANELEGTALAATTPIATEQVLGGEAATPVPDSPIVAPTLGMQPSAVVDGLDDPTVGLAALSEVAQAMQSQGIHTLRLTMDLSVPIEATVRNEQQVDENLTSLVRNQLSNYDVQGNYIIDISVDDLAQQKWVIEALVGVVGLGSEEMTELQQNGDEVWERPIGGEWSSRRLAEDESLLPLGNSLVTIDAYSHALNLSDLVVDALRPLLLAGDGEPLATDQDYGWKRVDGVPSTSVSFLEVQRERVVSSSNNLKSVAASLANSGLSTFVDPAAVTNGIQQITSFEKAWLVPDTCLVSHNQVEIQGKGVIEATYLMQRRLMDATVILSTNSLFEYLSSTTIVTAPE
jgi:hypothetical protein